MPTGSYDAFGLMANALLVVAYNCRDAWQGLSEIYTFLINHDIVNYCNKNNFKLIWFKFDIENVFLGKTINQSMKTIEAKKYSRIGKVNEIADKLNCCDFNSVGNGNSNVLTVLDEFFNRKKTK